MTLKKYYQKKVNTLGDDLGGGTPLDIIKLTDNNDEARTFIPLVVPGGVVLFKTDYDSPEFQFRWSEFQKWTDSTLSHYGFFHTAELNDDFYGGQKLEVIDKVDSYDIRFSIWR